MIIENITEKKDVCIITFGNDKQLAVDPHIVKSLRLSKGSFCDLETLKVENEHFSASYAEKCALLYLSSVWHTEKQLKEHLYGKHIQTFGVKYAVDKMKSYGYIDDGRYAVNFVRTASLDLKGPTYIKSKLREKGIDGETIETALETYTNEQQQDNLKKLLTAKNKSMAKIPPELRRDKLYRSASAAGYSSQAINALLSEVTQQDDENRDYSDFFAKKIDKKITSLINKGNDIKAVRQKIRAEFYAKGADETLIEDRLNEISEE